MAILASSSIVLPIPRVWAVDEDDYSPHAMGFDPESDGSLTTWMSPPEVIPAPPDGNWNGFTPAFSRSAKAPSSHYSTSPRKAYIMVHHAGYANSHTNTNPCTACNVAGQQTYDFCIDAAGDICNTGQWSQSSGIHAIGCNCATVGIMLHGCFGGCASGNVTEPTNAQLCSLAYLSLHLNTQATLNRHRPHRRCFYWNPCGSAESTVCPGTNLTTASSSDTNKWNNLGEANMNEMLTYRANLASGGCCYTPQCT